jgi:hypothetical protein
MNLFGLDPDYDRLRIRALRATPPGHPASGEERRQVFCAALGQFDELLTAAAAIGPASRPLPLYYALNQAGRAITASRQRADGLWKPRWHGLVVGDPEQGSLQRTQIRLQNKPDGSFRLLAEALNMKGLSEPTYVCNAWAAIPNLPRPGLGAGCPKALPLEVQHTDPIVKAVVRRQDVPATDAGAERVRAHIQKAYPRAADGLRITNIVAEHAPWKGSRATLGWHDSEGGERPIYRSVTRYLGGYYLLPHINSAGDVLEPLLLWWCLLQALSSLARYHSAEWTAALDPDRSPWCTSIEQTLDMALQIVPRLVLNALAPGTEEIIGLEE